MFWKKDNFSIPIESIQKHDYWNVNGKQIPKLESEARKQIKEFLSTLNPNQPFIDLMLNVKREQIRLISNDLVKIFDEMISNWK